MFVAATAGQDTTLIVNTANGTWMCNDDYGGRNPMVEINNPQPGQYDIWVGSYTSGQYISGTLRITELDITPTSGVPAPAPGPGPAPSGGTLDFSLSPNYGSQNLSAGFTPDPFQVNITSARDGQRLLSGRRLYRLRHQRARFPPELERHLQPAAHPVHRQQWPGYYPDRQHC
jgi:hypothetical protein